MEFEVIKFELKDDGKAISLLMGKSLLVADYTSHSELVITMSTALPWYADDAEEVLKASLEALTLAKTRFHDRMQLEGEKNGP